MRRLATAVMLVLAATTTPIVLAQPAGSTTQDRSDGQRERMLELLTQLQRLEEEVRLLRGELEVQSHKLESLKQRQRELYLDIDRRLRDLEVRSSGQSQPAQAGDRTPEPQTPADADSPPAAAASPDAADGPSAGQERSAQALAAEREAYREAFGLLKEGRYDKAINAFKRFLEEYPEGDYADNAQYWLGEGYYVTRQFEQAQSEFKKVIDRFPDSTKVPDALLKLGYVYYELEQWQQARSTLESVKQRFPDTTVARLANSRLKKLAAEGH